jgi:DNA mismatch repair protein MutS
MPKAFDRASATPVMRQFLAAKSAYKDALLLFRMGDFYELFFEDAVVAARALDLTLTARNKGSEDEIPMAGVPYHAASSYVQRLLEQGFKVAICEQMADPSKVKGLVPREVVRVVTPGILYDDAGLVARKNHYLVAIDARADATGVVGGADIGQGSAFARFDSARVFGIAALDLSTGELTACEAADEVTALGELARLEPRELLAGPGTEHVARKLLAVRPGTVVREEGVPPLDDAEATAILDAQLGKGEGSESCPSAAARRAAARCVAMAKACEPGRALPIARLVGYELGDTLVLDDATQAHLELVRAVDGGDKGSLLAQMDLTMTAPGARLLRRRLLAPRTHVPEIRRRHDAVELFVLQPGLRAEVRSCLGKIADLERLAVKLTVDRAAPRDLGSLRASLGELPALLSALSRSPDPSAREALGVAAAEPWIDGCEDVQAHLAAALSDELPVRASDGGVMRDGFDPALDEARALGKNGQRVMIELEARLREESLIPSLKLRYTRVFGWYLEVTRTHASKVPATWRRKQTIATGERFTCDELDALADKLAHAEERMAVREAELYGDLVRGLARHVARLQRVAARLAEWDVASALAEVAHRDDFVRPEVDDSLALAILEGRHPVVEKLAAAGRFVPNDVVLDASPEPQEGLARLWLVTGPNMAGKSTLMRQVAIVVILAQMGAFVPARQATIGVVDRVLTRVGASDNLSKGESTFMVEMKETANVLRRATRRSLVVLDEIGRGTSTYDGLAIAWAVAEYLHDAVGCRAMFATHYHELTELAATRPGAQNFSVTAREHAGDIIFLHKLQQGAASRSYGVACARLAGLPEPVLARARAILGDLERGAALPGGAHASLRGRNSAGRVQLGLFDGGGAAEANAETEPNPALETLRAVDVDRLTPLEALQLVASLKAMVDPNARRARG